MPKKPIFTNTPESKTTFFGDDDDYGYHDDGRTSDNENDNEILNTSNVSNYPFLAEEEVVQSRPRSKAIRFGPDSISSASNSSLLTRTSSLGAQNQGQEGTCFAHVSARLITRLITQIIPNDFTINSDESNLLYNDKTPENITKYQNCFVTKDAYASSLESEFVEKILSKRCPIAKRYNHMILFYYTLFTITKTYGCNGYTTFEVLKAFCDDTRAFYGLDNTILGSYKREQHENGYIISKEIDVNARILIEKYLTFNSSNSITVVNIMETLSLKDASKSHEENWITNFPQGAREALKNKMYVGFSYSMPSNQQDMIMNKIYDVSVGYEEKCTPPIDSHVVVIKEWSPNDVTILNSWGNDWGNKGAITVPSVNYYKFVMNPSCEEFSTETMRFNYFVIRQTTEKGSKIYDMNKLNVGTKSRKLFFFGGKTKKRKNKKSRKNKKLKKTRKRK
jgi:hypothetical protein